jgi:hypothetical protein
MAIKVKIWKFGKRRSHTVHAHRLMGQLGMSATISASNVTTCCSHQYTTLVHRALPHATSSCACPIATDPVTHARRPTTTNSSGAPLGTRSRSRPRLCPTVTLTSWRPHLWQTAVHSPAHRPLSRLAAAHSRRAPLTTRFGWLWGSIAFAPRGGRNEATIAERVSHFALTTQGILAKCVRRVTFKGSTIDEQCDW